MSKENVLMGLILIVMFILVVAWYQRGFAQVTLPGQMPIYLAYVFAIIIAVFVGIFVYYERRRR